MTKKRRNSDNARARRPPIYLVKRLAVPYMAHVGFPFKATTPDGRDVVLGHISQLSCIRRDS